MRLALISDIHGNYQALNAVLADISQQHVDDIICLGDNIGYGPEPDRVIKALSDREILSVMGNHELALLNKKYYDRLNFITRDSLDITRELISPEGFSWISKLKPALVLHGARFVHGCPPSSAKTYLFNPSEKILHSIFRNFHENICFAGHTHCLNAFSIDKEGLTDTIKLRVQSLHLDSNKRYIIIPGSVGQPRDTLSDKAKYGIWNRNENSIEIKAIAYDVDTTIALLKKYRFPLSNIQRLKWQKK